MARRKDPERERVAVGEKFPIPTFPLVSIAIPALEVLFAWNRARIPQVELLALRTAKSQSMELRFDPL